MKTDKIHFTKLIKVNAPVDIAYQIENIANGKKSRRVLLNRSIEALFDDTHRGKACTYNIGGNVSYIFSGNESQEYQKIYEELIENLCSINKNSLTKKEQEEQKEEYKAMHREKVMNLINSCSSCKTVDPIYKGDKLISLDYYA